VIKHPMNYGKVRPTSVKHFRIFGSKCYIKRDDEDLGKFDSRTYEEVIFLGIHQEEKPINVTKKYCRRLLKA
jgi:hypothetical protein